LGGAASAVLLSLGEVLVLGAESVLIFLSSLATVSPNALIAAQEKGPKKSQAFILGGA
jgi:hypothetical protein